MVGKLTFNIDRVARRKLRPTGVGELCNNQGVIMAMFSTRFKKSNLAPDSPEAESSRVAVHSKKKENA